MDQDKTIHIKALDAIPIGHKLAIKELAGKDIAVKAVGFRRRVIYAPFKHRDVRIGNYLYLQLGSGVPEGKDVEVKNPSHHLWPPALQFHATNHRFRWSPVLHVNQTGYIPRGPKKALVGYYLGSLGELNPADALGGTNTVNVPSGTYGLTTFTYKKVGRLEIKADVLRPANDMVLPVVIYIHGGALINGSRAGNDVNNSS